MNCPQPNSFSDCIPQAGVPRRYGDTGGQPEEKPFVSSGLRKRALNSRARVGTGPQKVSPSVSIPAGTCAFKYGWASHPSGGCEIVAVVRWPTLDDAAFRTTEG